MPNLKSCFVFSLSVAAIVLTIIPEIVFARQVAFGNEKPLSQLQGIELARGRISRLSTMLTIDIPQEKCHIYGSELNGFSYIGIDDCEPFGKPGNPKLPFKTIVIKLEKNQKPTGIGVISGTYRELRGKIKIVPRPEPIEWSRNSQKQMCSPNMEIYRSQNYYPGYLVSYDFGSDNKDMYVYVRFYPIQHIPLSGEIVFVEKAEIILYYEESPVPNYSKSSLIDEQSIIICKNSFLSTAEVLASFHRDSLGVSCRIMTSEYIDSNYAPAEYPTEDGFAMYEPYWLGLYEYDLALKIISFLRLSHPNLENIVILGDAYCVPPSYYFGSEEDEDYWDMWVPSDIYYVSPDYDFVPNYKLGRISVSSSSEAANVINKIITWHRNAEWDSHFENAIVAGGQPFSTVYYDGELIASNLINSGFFDGHTISKYFRTDGNFTLEEVGPALRNGNCGIFYFIAHGDGSAIFFDSGDSIGANDVLDYSTNNHTPIFMTPACIDGIYDVDFVSPDYEMGFAEALLLSPGGAIAYFGGSRSNYGISTFHFDNGNLVFEKEEYMTGMFYYITQAYYNGDTTLGDLQSDAINLFLLHNSLSEDEINKYTLECFILHGDPVLPIPKQHTVYFSDTLPWVNASGPTFTNLEGIPTFHIHSLSDEILMEAISSSSQLNFKFVIPSTGYFTDPIVETWTDYSFPFDYNFAADEGNKIYTLRAETPSAHERWFYVHSYSGLIFPDGDKTDWELAGLFPIASDPADFSPDLYELTNLYIRYSDGFWYFGFDAFPEDTGQMMFSIAIDSRSGGYSGVEGSSLDAGGNYVTFSSEHPVDYEILFSVYGSGAYVDMMEYTYSWEYSYPSFWEYSDSNYYAISSTGQFCEVQLPESWIGSPEEIDVVVYSTYYYSPAQDAVPSNPSTYTTPHLDPSDANTLTVFAHASRTGINEGYSKEPIKELKLSCVPNPFNSSCKIEIPNSEFLIPNIEIFDLNGKSVGVGLAPTQHQGDHEGRPYIWQPDKSISSGIYIVRVTAPDGQIAAKRVVYLK